MTSYSNEQRKYCCGVVLVVSALDEVNEMGLTAGFLSGPSVVYLGGGQDPT